MAWQAGDREAGGALIDRYFDAVRRFFESKAHDDIEDLIQQTFLALVGRRDNSAMPPTDPTDGTPPGKR
ncbi:MAG: hypothetical protein IAG13_14020 [Deltaproteobacteria bacterium]|nr:hypothetical protein [Nannocystaceae bacterium]